MAGQVMKRRRLVNAARRRRRMTPAQIRHFGTKRQKAGLRLRLRNRKYRYRTRPLSKMVLGVSRKERRAVKRGAPEEAGYYRTRSRERLARSTNPRRRRSGMTRIWGGISRKARRAIKAGATAKARYYRSFSSERGMLRNRSRRRSGMTRIWGGKSRKERRAIKAGATAKARYYRRFSSERGMLRNRPRRRSNVGEILTVLPAANPGRRRRSMARTHSRRRTRLYNRRYRNRSRRRYTHRHRRHNPRVVVRYRNRRRMNYRRRNQGRIQTFLSGDVGKVVGVLGGATVTGILTNLLPSNFRQGWMGYLATAGVAFLTGNVAGRVMNNRSLGNWITVGGLLLVGLQVANQFFPGLQLPFTTSGTSGMGLLTSSNFYVPQVNLPGSMASFVTPAGIPAPVAIPATALRGLGQGHAPIIGLRTQRRIGRLR